MWMHVYNMQNVHDSLMIKHVRKLRIAFSQRKIIKVWKQHAQNFYYAVIEDNFFLVCTYSYYLYLN